jgi:hypothetical protein
LGSIYGDTLDRCVIAGTDDELRQYFPSWPHVDLSYPSVTGLDPGSDHPFAGIHLVASPRGLVAVGEYLERDKLYQQHAASIQRLRRGFTSRVGIDRSQKQAITEFALYGLYTVPAENDVIAGINRCASWMLANVRPTPRDLPTGGLILPYALVPRTIKQLRSYRWAENDKKDGSAKGRELVYKKKDDLPDALRYALMTYPSLPAAHPAIVGRRDLRALDDKTRVELERMRRLDDAERTPPQLSADGYIVEGYDEALHDKGDGFF